LEFIALSVFAVLLVVSVSACENASVEIPRANIHPEKVDEIAALLPESVRSSGKFVIAAETSFAPAEFIAEDEKTPIGYDMDLARAIGAVLGLETEIQYSPFDNILPAVGTKYDVGISGFTYTEERLEAVDFVTYLKAGLNIAVQVGNPTGINSNIGEDFDTTYLDLCGRTVGVQLGVVAEEYMHDWSDLCEADGLDKINILGWQRQADVSTALVGGKIELFVADTPVVDYAIAKASDKLAPIGHQLDSAYHGIIFKKGNLAYETAVAKAVQYLIDSGDYQAILDYWGVSDCAVEYAQINPQFDEQLNDDELDNSTIEVGESEAELDEE
jgi:polar amino acid transport system substrate-binding protein